ncbi:MAG: hypothetical protein LVQ95_00310 [Candidatus Micrarchaeales archaeon]|nr:hypothetical protein [Candidatus Micrarchaeales archaeon]
MTETRSIEVQEPSPASMSFDNLGMLRVGEESRTAEVQIEIAVGYLRTSEPSDAGLGCNCSGLSC